MTAASEGARNIVEQFLRAIEQAKDPNARGLYLVTSFLFITLISIYR